MQKINVTDLRQHLQGYLKQVLRGESIQVTVHGKVVARLIPEKVVTEQARQALAGLRATASIGDLISPIEADWEATRDHM